MFLLPDFIRLNRRRHPDLPAAVDGLSRSTHRELSDRAWSLASGLTANGVRPGDRVGVLSGNSTFALETFLGIVAAGAVYVPFNWRWTPAELIHGIALTTPSVVLVEEEFRSAFDAAVHAEIDHRFRCFGQASSYGELLGHEPVEPDVALSPEAPAVILFTGGTTGFAKGVELSHRSVVFNAVNELVDLRFGAGQGQVGLCTVPLFHSASLLTVFAPHYIAGGTTAVLRRFTEEGFAEIVERERVTSTFATPNMLRRLLTAGVLSRPGLRCLRQIHSGAGLLRMHDKEAIRAALPDVELFFRYGLTEAGPMVTRLRNADIMRPDLDGSVGSEYTFAEVQLQDPAGQEIPDGELGEICVRGPALMTGYFGQPAATRDVLRDGWLHTGDLAVRGKDGNLFFRDRIKDMIKTGGENVYASEIEQLLHTHPAVMECAVVGVPSEEWDEEVRAVVVLRPGSYAGADDLGKFLRAELAGYKIPKHFAFLELEQMPINASGKIIKSRLRDLLGWP
ncbi:MULTISPECIES: class I adenylate-forming enzyme family protein [unclassified Parafrankia]|uniref:class I adenylate-forming enzyme family protein n=1 Tax=unclassified Parafrankia TaxID=2994368 RepID=UPI000DA47752|nr:MULTISPECIES: AMP-binding protein [unclassified Parafrankia]TCJ33498.1 long-chain fatty acid--CoA ligase [Parafrankia sp. BMG5.11]SQD97733.1 Fatty-acid--CoA ligase [Parafrankia sp. Ea1.12]